MAHELQVEAAVMSAPGELSPVQCGPTEEYAMVPVLTALMLILTSLSTVQWLARETAPAVRRGEFVSRSQLRTPPPASPF